MKRPAGKEFLQAAAFVVDQVRHRELRSVLVTSARLGEGTTTTVLGVARELHHSYGMRALALELNPRAKGFQAMLRLERPPVEYADGVPLSAAGLGLAPGGFALLSVGGGARGPRPPGDAIVSLRQLLESAAKQFDVVLVDAPPVLEAPEALAAAPYVDGVLLVVEAGRTRIETLKHVRSMFDAENRNLLGSVLTKQKYAIPGWLYRLVFR